ncbi:MAG: hypothetical protein KIC77_03865 [Clostridiales bacterium]|nr:hypothetical protein [Clostridiales bacterium]
MRKGRNKSKAKQNTVSKPLQSVNMKLPQNMSAEEMQHIIARAIVEAEEIKARKEKEKNEQERLEWQISIGHRDFSYIKNKAWKNIRIYANKIHKILAVLFIKKKKVNGDWASTAFLQSILTTAFAFLQVIAFLLCIGFISTIFINIASLGTCEKIVVAIFALMLFVLSCIFRMIKLEIDKLDDRNYLFGLFASITSLVSIIIAVIAIVKGA